MQFEHKLTKYEVDNHCVLLRDDAKADHTKAFGGHNKLTVKAENGKLYPAEINEYYLDGKFQAGIHFEGGKANSFFIEQAFFLGHVATITVDGAAPLVEGRLPVDVSFKILTR
jgi:hypothetical protein